MADVIVFHHALGLTEGVVAFADELRAHGHRVIVPDLYEGRTFSTVDEGVAHAEELGFDHIVAAGAASVEDEPPGLVYAGFSLGTLPAQYLAQNRPGARGALLYHGGVPPATFGTPWPDGVALQLHMMNRDTWCEVDVAEEMVRGIDGARLFLYPGSDHLFTDASLDEHDPQAAALVMERTLAMLDRVG